MNMSYSDYLKKFFGLDYKDYLLISSNDKREFYFTEYQRYLYNGNFNLTIHHYVG